MVKDTIDRDPKYVFHHPNVQSILLWLFQSQDDPKITKMSLANSRIFLFFLRMFCHSLALFWGQEGFLNDPEP